MKQLSPHFISSAQKELGLSICIHRSAREIGGNCIEIKASSGERILLDAGRPLDTPEGESTPIPPTLDTAKPVAGVLLSHAHQDHCGLLEMLPAGWPVYCGEATESQLHLSAAVSGRTIAQTCVHWASEKTTTIGPFKVTPQLIDHSAFDAYLLQIDVDGKTIVYSGDFRAHGRKAILTKRIMQRPPKRVDALIMEGTNLPITDSMHKSTATEAELEEQFVKLFKECQGHVFVSWACTNIDRTVTLYRACIRSGRVLVPDLYCMLVQRRLGRFANIPQPDWKGGHMRAVVTRKMIYLMERLGEADFIEELKLYHAAMSAKALAGNAARWVIMARGSLLEDYAAKGVVPNEQDVWVWSMWKGYLKQESTWSMREFFSPCRREYIHSSGHASLEVLQRFAEALRPKMLIPVHGENWQEHTERFSNVTCLNNGQWVTIP